MANYNRVLLMGNLTRDVELRHTPSNTPVANIGLAVNRQFKTKEGDSKEETTFVECEAWGRTAEVMNQYLSKGRPVFIEGRLKFDSWEDQQGQKRSKLKVVIESFEFIDSRNAGGGAKGAPQPVAATGGSGPGHDPISEDDIPF
jgi:single-strand DNA-binding protein